MTAFFSVFNYRYLHLPLTVGVMAITLVVSLIILLPIRFHLVPEFLIPVQEHLLETVDSLNFSKVLMHGMLSCMLFAGALHIDYKALMKQKWAILILAVFGTLISTFIVGYLCYFIFNATGLEISLSYCLLFGALISPTDPIAVLAIMRRAGAPADLEMLISGESLFNDGVGVVLFSVIAAMIFSGQQASVSAAAILFFQQMVGAIVLGIVLGWIGYWLLKQVYDYHMDVLITLAIAFGGYELADILGTSGLITVVVAGLMAGQYMLRFYPKDELGRTPLDIFWKIVDELLNAILFMLIGLEILSLQRANLPLITGVSCVLIILLARFISVFFPIKLLSFKQKFSPYAISILTWGGLRGGLPIALALSLPKTEEREILVFLTYGVVAFSILVQGLSIGKLVRHLYKTRPVAMRQGDMVEDDILFSRKLRNQ